MQLPVSSDYGYRCAKLARACLAVQHFPPRPTHVSLMPAGRRVWCVCRCRPLSVSMGNAIKTLKLYISKTDPAGEVTPWGGGV